MNKKEYKRSIKNIKSILGLLSVSIVLLLIDILIINININRAYYGNRFQKYVSFLKDNSVYPKRKAFFLLFIVSVLAIIYYLIKVLILKLADTRKKKIKTHNKGV